MTMPSLTRLLLLTALLPASLMVSACDPSNDPASLALSIPTAWAAVTVEIEQLDVRDECDASDTPASTAGDFRLVAQAQTDVDGEPTQLSRVGAAIEAGVGSVPIGLTSRAQLRVADFASFIAAVTIDEWDGAVGDFGIAAEAFAFVWLEDDRCWYHINGPTPGVCLRDGYDGDFEVMLDRGGLDPCAATASVRIEIDHFERLEPGAHPASGFYVGDADFRTLLVGAPPYESPCNGRASGTVEGRFGDAVEVAGQCFQNGRPAATFDLVGDFENDNQFEGALLITQFDRALMVPARGSRFGELLTIELDAEIPYDEERNLVVEGVLRLTRL